MARSRPPSNPGGGVGGWIPPGPQDHVLTTSCCGVSDRLSILGPAAHRVAGRWRGHRGVAPSHVFHRAEITAHRDLACTSPVEGVAEASLEHRAGVAIPRLPSGRLAHGHRDRGVRPPTLPVPTTQRAPRAAPRAVPPPRPTTASGPPRLSGRIRAPLGRRRGKGAAVAVGRRLGMAELGRSIRAAACYLHQQEPPGGPPRRGHTRRPRALPSACLGACVRRGRTRARGRPSRGRTPVTTGRVTTRATPDSASASRPV